ncbi:hypothetical protein POM88_025650 [Heracleum sosnowskyi]|uniref:Transposase-associated domain-containing protein n=1 Tax=Heracleum sosnowskyi TaxID=360622 RepID=A0AAD8I4I2_9APIA|nr:hypothetical protein POM88_025650 [Heracleum sosnowskyi]
MGDEGRLPAETPPCSPVSFEVAASHHAKDQSEKMSSNRSWISHPNQRGVNGLSQDFLNGINEFISFAERNCKEADGRIRCPCFTCCNSTLKSLDEVRFDIVSNGFLPNYTYWDSHGEGDEDLYSSESDEGSHSSGSRDEIDDDDEHDVFDPYEMLRDAGGFGEWHNIDPNHETPRFFGLGNDHQFCLLHNYR